MLSIMHAYRSTCGLLLAILGSLVVLTACSSGPSDVGVSDGQAATLLRAAERGSKTDVRRALDRGVSINVADDKGWTALHFAANRGHDELVLLLTDRGADVNAQDSAGNTPLHLAARRGHDDTCRKLLSGGASRTARNTAQKTPEDLALTEKVANILRLTSTD